MADTVGVSSSQISREFIAASEQQFRQLCERRFDDIDIVAIYIDGLQYGDCHVIVALGVDSGGFKHVLGLREGSSENSRVATDLLNDLVDRGIKPDRLRLFVIARPCVVRSMRFMVQRIRSSVVAIIRFATYWVTCLMIRNSRSNARCGLPGVWMPAKVNRSCESWHNGSSASIPPQLVVFWKVWVRCLPLMLWVCRKRFVAVWARRMLSSHRTAAFALEPDG